MRSCTLSALTHTSAYALFLADVAHATAAAEKTTRDKAAAIFVWVVGTSKRSHGHRKIRGAQRTASWKITISKANKARRKGGKKGIKPKYTERSKKSQKSNDEMI